MTMRVNDAIQLYQHNIVEYKNELQIVVSVAVRDDTGELYLVLRNIRTGSVENVEPDPELVCCPSKYRLGYYQINMESNAVYLTRAPRRQYSIGWTQQNVPGLPSNSVIRATQASFLSNLAGKFPTFELCRELVTQHRVDVAFDKQFAIHRSGERILYRGEAPLNLHPDGTVSLRTGFSEKLLDLFQEAKEKK